MAAPAEIGDWTAEMLTQFCGRIGLARSDLCCDLASLHLLAASFTATIPFENLDCALGRGVDTTLPAVFTKIVTAGRGGYCFENNGLMHFALRALGFEVARRVARVVLGPSPSGFTHLVNIVRLADGAEFLVDVGFGGSSLRAPLPLASLLDRGYTPAGTASTDGRVGEPVLMYPDVHRLVDDMESSCLPPGAYRLQSLQSNKWHAAGMPARDSAEIESCWLSQYAFHPNQPVSDRDIVVGSHYVSTLIDPSNFFTGSRLAVLLTPAGKKVLSGDTLTHDRRVSNQDLVALFPNCDAGEFQSPAHQVPATASADEGKGADGTARSAPVSKEEVECGGAEWFEALRREFGADLRWDRRDLAGPLRQRETRRQLTLRDFLPGARGGGGPAASTPEPEAEPEPEPDLGPVSLREITRQNLESVLDLKASPAQQRFVAPNSVTLAEAAYGGDEDFSEGGVPWCRAIYAGDVPVGFVAIEDNPSAAKYYLWRFMLDQHHQRKGYGTAAIRLVVDYVRTRPGVTCLMTSYEPSDASVGAYTSTLRHNLTSTGTSDRVLAFSLLRRVAGAGEVLRKARVCGDGDAARRRERNAARAELRTPCRLLLVGPGMLA
jgi:diamine N-acetyltransferase